MQKKKSQRGWMVAYVCSEVGGLNNVLEGFKVRNHLPPSWHHLINQDLPKLTKFNHDYPILTKINWHQQRSTKINKNQQRLTKINQDQPRSTKTRQDYSSLTKINKNQARRTRFSLWYVCLSLYYLPYLNPNWIQGHWWTARCSFFFSTRSNCHGIL